MKSVDGNFVESIAQVVVLYSVSSINAVNITFILHTSFLACGIILKAL